MNRLLERLWFGDWNYLSAGVVGAALILLLAWAAWLEVRAQEEPYVHDPETDPLGDQPPGAGAETRRDP